MAETWATPRRIAHYPHPQVSIIIGTYGDEQWNCRGNWLAGSIYAEEIAYRPSVDLEVINVHGKTLADARNHGANEARGQWLVFLDADDYLGDGYCHQIMRAATPSEVGVTHHVDDVLCPSVQGFRADIVQGPARPFCGYENFRFLEEEPVFPKRKSLIQQNYLPIGAAVHYDIFEHVGGFEQWPVLEDWAFWLKCEKAGATFGDLPEAVYLINDDHQRNKHPDIDKVAMDIRAAYR